MRNVDIDELEECSAHVCNCEIVIATFLFGTFLYGVLMGGADTGIVEDILLLILFLNR